MSASEAWAHSLAIPRMESYNSDGQLMRIESVQNQIFVLQSRVLFFNYKITKKETTGSFLLVFLSLPLTLYAFSRRTPMLWF